MVTSMVSSNLKLLTNGEGVPLSSAGDEGTQFMIKTLLHVNLSFVVKNKANRTV